VFGFMRSVGVRKEDFLSSFWPSVCMRSDVKKASSCRRESD